MSEKEKYQKYLCSPEWWSKRNAVMRRSLGRCERCGAVASHVHHLTYARKYNENLDDLQAVCEHCHECIHNPLPAVDWKRPSEGYYSMSPFEHEIIEILISFPAITFLVKDRMSSEWLESAEGKRLFTALIDGQDLGEDEVLKQCKRVMKEKLPCLAVNIDKRLEALVSAIEASNEKKRLASLVRRVEELNDFSDEALDIISQIVTAGRKRNGLVD